MSQFSTYALYTASFLSAVSVAGHTQMGNDFVYPALNLKSSGPKGAGAGAAKIGWLEGNQVFAIMGILYAKWAKYGLVDNYEKAILAFTMLYQFSCGVGFVKLGVYKPLLALWLTPALAVAGLVL